MGGWPRPWGAPRTMTTGWHDDRARGIPACAATVTPTVAIGSRTALAVDPDSLVFSPRSLGSRLSADVLPGLLYKL